MQRLLEPYFLAWAAVLPVMSLLVFPAVQGTTPAYLFALGSIGWLLFIRRETAASYVRSLMFFVATWAALTLGSQAALFLSEVTSFQHLRMVDLQDTSILLRRSLLTQSLYLLACFFTFLFFRYIYRSEWRRYLFLGGWLLAGYGVYEWLFYLLFHRTGDFIANRSFSGDHPGSWSQVFHFGNFDLLRIKSVTGEPSFFAFAAMPYLIFALSARRWYLVAATLFGLLLSFSTSAYIALLLLAVYCFITFGARSHKQLSIAIGLALVIGIAFCCFPAVYQVVIGEKLAGRSQSAVERKWIYESAWYFWLNSSPLVKLFGIGFGYAYVIPLLEGILINTGLVGLTIFVGGFLKPLIRLPNTPATWPLKGALLIILFLLSTSIPEFAYPTTWMVLGLAYRELDKLKKRNRVETRAHDFESVQEGIMERTRSVAQK